MVGGVAAARGVAAAAARSRANSQRFVPSKAGPVPALALITMSKPRYHPPSVQTWMLGSKCVDDQFLLAPTPEARLLMMLSLAKVQQAHDIEIVAFVFMANHFHLIVRVRGARLAEVMRDFKSGLAKEMNKILGRRGTFWMERYDDDALLDDAAVATKLHYLHANPLRAGLVERIEDFPGVSSWEAHAKGLDALTETYFDEAAWREAGGDEGAREAFTRTATVKIGRPPSWDGMSARERRRATNACVAEMRAEERSMAAERERARRTVPSTSSMVTRDPRSRPKHPKRAPKRKWASGTPEQIAAFREAYREMFVVYRAASLRFRETGILGPFPAGTYPPRIMHPLVEV